MTAALEPSATSVITMRSIYVSPPVDSEFQRAAVAPQSANSDPHENGNATKEEDGKEDALAPIKLPQSTHSLLFTEPVFSLPFAFAVVILFMAAACLGLAFATAAGPGTDDIPVNVTNQVRGAQYLSIFIALLMEEEIPTGLFLLRMIPRQSLHRKYPKMMYWKFITSSCVRIFNGYFFLINVLVVLTFTTGVIEIFYDVLALQFVQQLDDIAFNLAKMDVFGKSLQRACTAKCFRAEFDKKRFGRIKHLSIFLKAIYFVNLCGMLGWMGYVSIRQIKGDYYDNSITLTFGDTVWEKAWVKVPEWLDPGIRALSNQTDEYEEWMLVYSYFNGIYEKNGTHDGHPIYTERRKSDRKAYATTGKPAQVKYCKEIESWVFTHENIYKKKSAAKEGCNWLLRSPQTTDFDVLDVVGDWKVWTGVIEKAELSITSNECHDKSDCNLNGECKGDKCECDTEDDVQYLGSHCEVELRDSCQTVIGEGNGEPYYSSYLWEDPNSEDSLVQQYSRPIYWIWGIDPDTGNEATFNLLYAGNRWFLNRFFAKDSVNVTDDELLLFWLEYHAFWYRASLMAIAISDPTTGSTPVGVDFYGTGERGEQFGPFGALYPLQLNNQTGRGYFRCNDTDTMAGNASSIERKLQLQNHFRPKHLKMP